MAVCGKKSLCGKCEHYQESKRYYDKLPRYTTNDMDLSLDLQDIAIVPEVSICTFDYDHDYQIMDIVYLKALECLQNIYYFNEVHVPCQDTLVEECFQRLYTDIQNKLDDVSNEQLSKIIGVLYFVTKRRTLGGREHLQFLHRHVGAEVAPNVFKIA